MKKGIDIGGKAFLIEKKSNFKIIITKLLDICFYSMTSGIRRERIKINKKINESK